MNTAALPVSENLRRFPDLHPALDSQSAVAEANRCLYCFDAPCTAACPTHIDVPRFIKKIATGNLRGSALTILDANILGLSCSRVCPVDVLCEGSCVMHRYNKKPIEIALLQRHAMEHFYASRKAAPRQSPTPNPQPPTVACVGAGPASLACAAELRRHGFAVTIFEKRPLAGGLNTYGVAEYKLRPADSLREVEMIRSMGVEFRQAEIGVAMPLEELESIFDFIFIGIGLGAMDNLGVPGENAAGVIDALRFIERYKTHHRFIVGRRIVVIGGGNTAIDAANAALRLGADEAHVFYRRARAEMPAFSFEYEHSKLEGVRFHWLAQPVEIIACDGRVAAVRFIRTKLTHADESGRRRPEPVPGSEFEFHCDMVIPALGQSRQNELRSKVDNRRYFAGGDFVNGGREVVDAVAEGKRAALAIVEAARG
jgi:glutamate synthase (NADPH/NADH) small chain